MTRVRAFRAVPGVAMRAFAGRLAVALALAACGRAVPPASPGPDAVGPSSTERMVQAQVAAYNRRDLDAFLATMAPDARLYAFPDSLLHAGHDELRRVYGRLFAKATGLRADVRQRVVQGRYVIDRETTYGLPGRGPTTGVAIYEVRNGRIARVWFMD